jgi:hypothetical protein
VWDNIPASTLTSQGYRQAIITITPQSGQNFLSLFFNVRHNQAGLQAYSTGFLDFKMAGSFVNTFQISNINLCLEEFTYVGTNSITSFSGAFSGCRSLKRINSLHTNSANSMTGMFENCISLKTIPLLNTGSATLINSMFNGCFSLKTIPLLNTSSATTTRSMFSQCFSLKTIPPINTTLVNDFFGMLTQCRSLKTIPLLNTNSGVQFTAMFQDCTILQTVPIFTFNVNFQIDNMFANCTNLQEVPAFNLTLMITSGGLNNTFSGCPSLKRCSFINIRRTIRFANCMLSATELVEIFNNLVTTTGETITITGNWGASLLTPAQRAIATGKGWTITG